MSYLEIDCQSKNKHQKERERESERAREKKTEGNYILGLRLYNTRQSMTTKQEEEKEISIGIFLLLSS